MEAIYESARKRFLENVRCRTRQWTMTRCGILLIGIATASLAAAGSQDSDWISINGNVANQRYVPLDQINTKTIAKLGAVWVSERFADGATSRMTPLVHDGLMFLGAGARIYALNAQTGASVWVHQMETRPAPDTGVVTKTDVEFFTGLATTRSFGLSVGGGMIFGGLMNGHVIALQEKTGTVLWDKLISTAPLAYGKVIVCTPLYVDGVLYFGMGVEGGEQPEVVAVEALSGRVLWRLNTVPAPGQPGHDTWPRNNEIWRLGGATPWVTGAADSSLGLVYFGTGNAFPAGDLRPGDDLYSVTLLALEMKTGHIRWYRQLVHHDVFEADLSVSPVLFDGEIQGHTRKGVAILRGDGFIFTFDRATGEPLVPIDERPVPQNPLISTALTQPFPRGADSILAPCESWRNKIPASFVLGCMFDPPDKYVPNRLGAWASARLAPMSYSPKTHYLYVQGTNSLMWVGTLDDPYLAYFNIGDRVPNLPQHTVVVAAVDSRTDKVIWRKDLPTYDDNGFRSNGGALSTSGGIVFHQGGDGTLQGYDASTGATLWRFQTDFAVGDASPMSYAIDGKQYVAFIAGSKVWAFGLGGAIPQAPPISPPPKEELAGPIVDTNEIETLTLEQPIAIGHRYQLEEYEFNPYRARIRLGTPITFINNGFKPHTIVARDGSWTTGTLNPSQTATVTIEKPGSYVYFSREYPWSYGQIIVTSADSDVNAATEVPHAPGISTQVALGKTVYAASCSACHGDNLQGRAPAPALEGRGFGARWSGRDALDLFDRIRTTMPAAAPGTLTEDNYTAIVAYILYANDRPPLVTLSRQTMKGLAIAGQ
jgi:quinohemoprotein ethanol dehydrogenase